MVESLSFNFEFVKHVHDHSTIFAENCLDEDPKHSSVDLKQSQNIIQSVRRKEKKIHQHNLADEMLEVFKMANDKTYIKVFILRT